MGRIKEMMMDWEFGLMHAFDKDKYVCVKHFSDPYLNEYIIKNGHKGKCSYCGEKHTIANFALRVPLISVLWYR